MAWGQHGITPCEFYRTIVYFANQATINMIHIQRVKTIQVCAVAGHGPVLTVAHTKYIEVFRYEEHHGWQFKCAKEIQYPPERQQAYQDLTIYR